MSEPVAPESGNRQPRTMVVQAGSPLLVKIGGKQRKWYLALDDRNQYWLAVPPHHILNGGGEMAHFDPMTVLTQTGVTAGGLVVAGPVTEPDEHVELWAYRVPSEFAPSGEA